MDKLFNTARDASVFAVAVVKLKALEALDGIMADKLINAFQCWKDGHEWFSKQDEFCDKCVKVVCARCSRYAGTVTTK